MAPPLTTQHPKGVWDGDNKAEEYKDAENLTRVFSDILIKQTGVDKFDRDIYAFDFACGTGAAVASLYSAIPKSKWSSTKVLGGDVNDSMLQYLKKRGEQEGWTGLETKIVDGANIQLPSNTYTHLLINFGVQHLPSSVMPKAYDLLKPNGIIGITTWAKLPWYPYVVKAASLVQPNPPPIPSESDFMKLLSQNSAFDQPDYLRSLLSDVGFQDVRVERVESELGADFGAAGTPHKYVDILRIPLTAMSGMWGEEEEKEKVIGGIQEKLLGVLKEEFGEEGPVVLKWVGVVSTGRKAE